MPRHCSNDKHEETRLPVLKTTAPALGILYQLVCPFNYTSSMNVFAIDTAAAITELKNAQCDDSLAEAIVNVIAKGQGDVASKTDIDTQFKIVASKFDSMDTRIGVLEARLDTLDSRLNTLESRMSALETRMGAVECQLESLSVRMGTVEKKVDSLDEKLDSIKTNVIRWTCGSVVDALVLMRALDYLLPVILQT